MTIETAVYKLQHFDWNGLPKFVVGPKSRDMSTAGQAAGYFVADGVPGIGGALSKAVDRSAHSPSSLAVFLNTRVYIGVQAHKRSRYWWGRIYNKFSGDHAYFIKLKGLHLIQTLRIVDQIPQDQDIPVTAHCALRLDYAIEILQILKTQLAEKDN
jgi:hypothetical protein